jgi:uncharacterized protein (TIGR00369 family)
MEAELRSFCDNWWGEQAGRMNALCRPQFVSCDFESKTLCLRYAVQDWMLNSADIMHGGVVSTVFDLTMGLLSWSCSGGGMTPTASMQVTFLRPIPAGETLVVAAGCDKPGRALCCVTARAWLESAPDKPAATASATFFSGNSYAKED